MLTKYLVQLVLVILPAFSWAGGDGKEESKSNAIDNIKAVVSFYQKSSAIKMSVDKEVYYDYMESTKKSKGTLILSKGRLRLEIDEPDSFLMLMTDHTIWIENRLPPDLGGIQISKVKASKKLKERNALLAFLFDNITVWDSFTVIDSKAVDKLTAVSLKPKKGQDIGDVVKVNLLVDSKNKKIMKIVYWDSLDNKTTYGFSDIKFNAKITQNIFDYSPPKGASVNTL